MPTIKGKPAPALKGKKPHRVWIEIEKPKTPEEAIERSKLLSAMLKRLGMDAGDHALVWWNQTRGAYCFTTDAAGSYVEAGDSGHWFNLEYLANPQRSA